MEQLDCRSFRVCYGAGAEVLEALPAAEYVIARTERLRTREIAALRAAGFVFHERFIKIEINIASALRQLPVNFTGGDVAVRETRGFTEEMLALACAAYDADRRFHLEEGFDDGALAGEVISAKARAYASQQARIMVATHAGDLLGYCTFLPCGDGYRNVMGLTARGMKGKLAAWPLYTGALRILETGGGKYIGNVSSTNVASLNLHMRLGARVTGTEDWYILRRR